MELEQLQDDRELVVIALQALHRERVNAYHAAFTFADMNNNLKPKQEDFGITEAVTALRRIGAAPTA
ncbi:hypothetical protein HUO09_17445 [Vibrio sp. Y2-5]|uniref:hypothetical protein n=1 Tax=Vibrio sp. Y2-5 TaxID=2743977 RepID=UPI0016609E1D|nr:hypothetical protein [Vibrio sp. Y2-5]MBD0788142.1 hypothetical protein [Vibrio sp. Y2-5]